MAIGNNTSIWGNESDSDSKDSNSSSRNNKKPKAKKVTNKRRVADYECENDFDSEDSDNSSDNNKKQIKSEQRLESMIGRVEINLSTWRVVYNCVIFM